jgi:DNA (cytosine-5)-methyltransferase 1
MRHGSLFSGIGGFDLAAQWMQWKNVFHVEYNPFCQTTLNYYWPHAKSYKDIHAVDFTVHRGEVDIISGGFPCQPFSTAGKRTGSDDSRYLWPEMLRAVREIRPTWVVGENVPGLISWSDGLVLKQVCSDLENEGFEVWPFVLPACGINAPHQRQRLFIIAHSDINRQANSHRRASEGKAGEIWRGNEGDVPASSGGVGDAANASGERWIQGIKNDAAGQPRQENEIRDTANPHGERQQECDIPAQPGGPDISSGVCFGQPITGRDAWQEFPTQSPIRFGDDGLPGELDGISFPRWRNESIKGYGNAVVPPLVYVIFKTIAQLDTLLQK